ncbi:YppE family protein [Bacillus changyiensis]|uniref:YppE family protein n=1 Tax=Bacillus changyiensis TaxID=3004103 RepID=UPI0022E4543E|nr:YppE family protein [Bacillus changyiensis]MDA1475276.1 YppE family protein [Bacillus changyiensis]
MDKQSFLKQTKNLIYVTKEAADRYQIGDEYDFFKTVKPAADRCEQTIKSWLENGLAYIEDHHPKYIHKEQLSAVEENLKEIVLQSYFCKIHKKRFKDLTESVLYTLRSLEEDLKVKG